MIKSFIEFEENFLKKQIIKNYLVPPTVNLFIFRLG